MAAPFTTPKDEWIWANESVARAKRELAKLEREAKSYYDDDEINFSNAFRFALFKAKEELKKAERKLKSTTKKLAKRTTNPMRKKITQKQLNALARGRRTAMANRKTKKKTVRKPARRKNPDTAPRYLSTIKLAAPNTPSGNPRRLYMVLRHGSPVAIYDEEYLGDHAVTDAGQRNAYAGVVIHITASEYNKFKKGWAGVRRNPAHGNFLNAIAAEQRGGLGREAYQNPVRPLRKRGDELLIATLDPRTGQVVYAGAFGWGPAGKAVGYQSAADAKKWAQKFSKQKSAIVFPHHSVADIKDALKR